MEKIVSLNVLREEIQKKKEKTQLVVVNYEIHNWLVRILRFPIVLMLNMLPEKIAKFVFTSGGSNEGTKAVCKYATTYRALETIYTYPDRSRRRELSLTDVFWGKFLNNSLALRNRLKLVKRELMKTIKNKEDKKVRLISLGSGSARAIIETIAELNEPLVVNAKLVDMSRDAINFSKKLALYYEIVGCIEYHRDYLQNIEKYCNGFQPDIVEMAGILDYFPNETAIDLINKVFQVLSPDGYLITSNICPNLEEPFVRKAMNWAMIYRTPQELGEVVVKSGFNPRNVKIITEPLGIHAVAICQKIV